MARIQFRLATSSDDAYFDVDEDTEIESFMPLRGKHRAGDLSVGDRVCLLTNCCDRGSEILEVITP